MPAITIVTQTSTKMPYSKLPIQRARKTWLTKAIAALTMRMAKAMTDMRLASPRSSALNSTASTRPSSGRARSARRSGRSLSAVVAAEKRTHCSPSFVRPIPYAKLFKKRLGGTPVSPEVTRP